MKFEVKDAPVRVTERRLTERVRNQWMRLAGDRLPSLREVEALNFGPDRDYCFAVDMRLSDILPYFIFMGEELARYSSLYPMGDARREKTLLDTAMVKMDEATLSRAPVEFSEIKRLDDGRRVAFRSILLPLSENGTDVSHIFGAARGKGV
ncbi:PAS domain-containing protein [Hyphococcus lacteus]|uniref:PAS domain-containing protein n=1 Tax=Hyphococcus lacteus TaxID=3143536 RepID=A0ABV3Z7T6_9PROT